MRRWLLVLIVLLLPLRGLVGEVMAGQMLQQHAAAATAPASAAPVAHDCGDHGHAAPTDEAGDTAALGDAPADCPTCASCQVCSSVALGPFVAAPVAQRTSQPPPQLAQRDPPSAEPALAFKPPRG